MKKNKINLAIIFLFSFLSVSAQDSYKFPTKFLSFDNSRLAIGLGLDAAINNMDMIKANFSNGVSLDTASRGLTNLGFSVDLYSPNSLIGFQSGLYWRFRDFVLYDQNVQDNQKQQFKLQYLSIPFYIKIRPGNHLAKTHFLALLGGTFDIPQRAEIKDYYTNNLLFSDNSILNSVFIPEVSIGLEISFGKSAPSMAVPGGGLASVALNNSELGRLYFFLKAGFNQQNTFIPNFTWMGYSPNNDWNFKNYYISFGLIGYLRLIQFSEKTM